MSEGLRSTPDDSMREDDADALVGMVSRGDGSGHASDPGDSSVARQASVLGPHTTPPGSLFEARARRWAWRHPHIVVWRWIIWARYVRVPPWRIAVSELALCNPRPLDAALRAGLMTKDPYEYTTPPAGSVTGSFSKTPEQPWAWRVQRETLSSPSPWWCGCSCGWLETGWPSYEVAKRSMDAHLAKAHV